MTDASRCSPRSAGGTLAVAAAGTALVLVAFTAPLATLPATAAAVHAGGWRTFHLGKARDNGLTESELIEAITHLAFYAGWPKAMSAMTVAKNLFRGDK